MAVLMNPPDPAFQRILNGFISRVKLPDFGKNLKKSIVYYFDCLFIPGYIAMAYVECIAIKMRIKALLACLIQHNTP